MSTVTVTLRMDADLKRDVDDICKSIGLPLSVAILMFIKKFVNDREYPFPLKAFGDNQPFSPYDEARILKARADYNENGAARTFDSVEEMEACAKAELEAHKPHAAG